MVLLFGLMLVVSVAAKASQHVVRVEAAEQRKSYSLQTLKRTISDCDTAFLRLGNGRMAGYAEFQQIKEDVRYLSPCDTPDAVSLDLEMACLLGDLCATLSSTGELPSARRDVQEALTRCRTLVRLRKQERQK